MVQFHITENRSLDLMHDFYEGVVHYTLSRQLTCIIVKDKLITIDQFNKLIDEFNYGDSFSLNKPQHIALKSGKNRKNESSK